MPIQPTLKRSVAVTTGSLALFASTMSTALAWQPGATSSVSMELETGAVGFGRNDVRIPGNTGTEFDMTGLTGSGSEPYFRLNGAWDINERHGLRVVIAPLEVNGTGTLSQPTSFAGRVFTPGPAEGTYQFSTYKLTYRYALSDRGSWHWRIGLTGLIRDANVELRQGALRANDDDVGLVPLLHVFGEYRFAPRWQFTVDFDGLASSQGRALDLALKLSYDLNERWNLGGGYRTLEGGVDNDDVYNFAWLHYGFVSVAYRF